MRPLILFVCLITFFPGISIAQENKQKTPEQIMAEKIRLLKNGALLFRIHTRENSISALRNAGNHEAADQVQKKQEEYNKVLIESFRVHFNFCPVYFFTADQTEKFLSGNPEKVVFINNNLIPDSSIHVTEPDFLTAEAGTLEPDTASFFEGTYYDYSNKNLEKDESHYSNNNMGIETIRIMNNRFVQLKDPFPYYVRLYSSLPVKRDMGNAVKKLDKKLWKYYKVTSGK